MAWAVDLDGLRAEIGNGDDALAKRYGASFTAHHDDVQELIDDVTDDGPAVTLADVARHMIMGEPYDERIGFAYGYFLEHLCDVQGRFLDNARWMPVPVDWCERVDEALASAGLLAEGFSTWDLVFGGAPVPLPRIDDFPGIGYREYGSLQEPAHLLAGAALADIAEEYKDAAYDVFQWLSHAHDSGCSVVAFFH
ncbi:hypothetical protein BG844_27030 [Couchioplanes caeruleus subsp. caeruleus]|uniref:DUF7691 domain-containing protein n=2 Tax=Couchioplanes caeruleus TaxID=56438 RepID=A0A1K0GGK4_9ACTN|nr:hypothetical protein BG844_27030 [Couchioplanes caeruleus subsp. caeruleus]